MLERHQIIRHGAIRARVEIIKITNERYSKIILLCESAVEKTDKQMIGRIFLLMENQLIQIYSLGCQTYDIFSK